jgi:hypothetical protein
MNDEFDLLGKKSRNWAVFKKLVSGSGSGCGIENVLLDPNPGSSKIWIQNVG